MATPIRIKRSAVPGKRPQVSDLQVGELALNTHDAELVTLRQRAFTHRFVSSNNNSVNVQSGAENGNQKTPNDATYIASTGVLTLKFASAHGLADGDTITLDNDSLKFTCDADNYATEHTYPRSTDPIAGVTTAVGGVTTTSFTINVGKGYSTEVVRTGAGATVTNVIYVTKDGNDNNTGLKLGDAKGTIQGAVGISTDGSVIRVSAGSYVEDNPIVLPKQVSLVGDSLREVSIIPKNVDKDIFHVAPGVMLQELTFSGTVDHGVASVAFNPDKIYYYDQSPYIRFCTNKVGNSIGLKIDGSKSLGPFKSMVTDSYTQYNANGIGVSISNEGYAQIVSMFTMNLDVGITCISGGQCDVTNSNSSFGNYGMISDGIGPRKYTGTIDAEQIPNQDTFVVNLGISTHSVDDAIYDGNSGILTVTTYTNHGLEVGVGVTLSKLGFTCDYGDYTHAFVSGTSGAVTVNTGVGYTAKTGTTYTPTTGELVIDFGEAHGLSAAGISTTQSASYTPTTGLLTINTQDNHGLSNGDYIKIADESLTFTCSRDGQATNHKYPRISDPVSNKWLPVTVVDTDTFTVNVGISEDYNHLYSNSVPGNIKRAVNTIGIATDGVTFTCSKDNNASNHSYPRTTDPAHNATLGIEAVTTNSVTVNVGVSTHDIFPSGINGYIFDVVSVPTNKSFSVYVGPNRHPHTYVSGGNVKPDIIRPFDGQVVFFDTLYEEVFKIKVSNGGSGYTSVPTVTIDAPPTDWGVQATAVAEMKNGKVDSIELVSSGRGYTSTPNVTITGGGGSSATASLVMVPKYYSITKSTPVSAGISTITVNDNVPYTVGVGITVPFYKQSRILASSHSFEYIGTGVDIVNSLPSRGAVPIQDNEIDDRNGGLTIFTSTDQAGQFRIGDGVIIDQQAGTITGTFYSKSLFSTMTPFILALGGD